MIQFNEKVFSLAVASQVTQDVLENSEFGNKNLQAKQGICEELKMLRESCDLDAMISAEATLIIADVNMALLRGEAWKDKAQSFNKAQEQMAKAMKSYEMLSKDTDLYNFVMDSQTHHPKQARERYPYDSFRSFADSHIARLRNDHRGAEGAKMLVLEAREANMIVIKGLYRDLQKKELSEITPNPRALEEYLSKKILSEKNGRETGLEQYRAEKAVARQTKQNKAAQEAGQERKPAKGRSRDEDRGRE